ncbi:hypothetical protein [Capnocytophaga sputigena]|uniref:hypothetical protein n=1 Tax=Capnocytophaga sputigena TaxID=1019 RepID=UPI0028D51111|nr:hypothetical protein [Capnocytophaga sputigena]
MFEKKRTPKFRNFGQRYNKSLVLSVEKRFSFNNGAQPDIYFDEELCKNRFKIEQAVGRLDGYKGLIMKCEYLDITWVGILLLGFISKFLKKV